MPRLPDQLGGECLVLKGADPEPLLASVFQAGFAPLNFPARNLFLGAHHPHRQRAVLSKGQIRRLPQPYPAILSLLPPLELAIGGRGPKPTPRLFIGFPPPLLSGKVHHPSHALWLTAQPAPHGTRNEPA